MNTPQVHDGRDERRGKRGRVRAETSGEEGVRGKARGFGGGPAQTFADLPGMKKPASQKDTGLSEHYVQWKMNQAFCAFIQAMASGRFRVPS